jgi:hypothetical protein
MANQFINGRYFQGLSANKAPTSNMQSIAMRDMQERQRQAEATAMGPFTGGTPMRASVSNPVVKQETAPDLTAAAKPKTYAEQVAYQQDLSKFIRDQGTGYYPGVENAYEASRKAGPATSEIIPQYDTSTVEGVYQPGMTLAQVQLAQAKSAEAQGQQRIETDLEKTLREIEEEQRAIYAPKFGAVERAGAQAKETSRRGFSFRGFGKSTSAIQDEERLNDMQAQQAAAVAAEQAASIRLQQAAARGASDKELQSLSDAVSNAQRDVNELEREMVLAQEGLTAAQVEAGRASEQQRIDNQLAALKAGFSYDEATGEFTQLSPGGDKLTMKQVITDAQGNSTAIIFNESTGKVETQSLGKIGIAKSTGGGGGAGGPVALTPTEERILDLYIDEEGNVSEDLEFADSATQKIFNSAFDKSMAAQATGGGAAPAQDIGSIAQQLLQDEGFLDLAQRALEQRTRVEQAKKNVSTPPRRTPTPNL